MPGPVGPRPPAARPLRARAHDVVEHTAERALALEARIDDKLLNLSIWAGSGPVTMAPTVPNMVRTALMSLHPMAIWISDKLRRIDGVDG